MEQKKKEQTSKIKVDALAKELGIDAKQLLSTLKDLKIPAKTKASAIDSESAKIVTDLFKPEKAPEPVIIKEVPPAPAVLEKEPQKEAIAQEPAAANFITMVPQEITVKDLASALSVKPSDLIKELMMSGIMVTINQRVDFEVAKEISKKFGIEIKEKEQTGQADTIKHQSPEDLKNLKHRPPVVTVMGHVDHGKTKLLDAIRKTNVIATEAGGITQHIGAYQVEIKGKPITFLDTPGHEAFTALRARGANATDIVVLVVAADDGVMPQTIEAIDHAKASKAPIIVAINKIDKEGANLDKVKQQLAEHGLAPEEWGGQTVTVPVSAKQVKGIDQLLEMILLVADILELKANPNMPAEGVVIESKLDKNKGPVATVLIKNGTLRVGDAFYSGAVSGKIRALVNDKGKRISKALPATPVEIFGISQLPQAGDILQVVKDEKEARVLAQKKKEELTQLKTQGKLISLEEFSQKIKSGETKTLNLIIKADVLGSLEALIQSIQDLSSGNIKTHIVHSAAGNITRSDCILAKASEAIIVGFGVDFDSDTKEYADSEGIDYRLYKIIYEVLDDIKLAMEGLLEPVYEEVIVGHAQVRQIFKFSKVGAIAGSFVTDGILKRGGSIRILREDKSIFDGKMTSLKRFKEDVKEVSAGLECGIVVDNFSNFKAEDVIEQFEMRIKKKNVKA